MKFGSVTNPEDIDFTLPNDHKDTKRVLNLVKDDNEPEIYVGCAKWNRADLKGFYPKGTKDELEYYSSQFNSIELNATFYRIFPPEQFKKWREKTPSNFKFFPKLNQEISHWKRLNEVKEVVDNYLYSAVNLQEKLGTIFLQMHNNFAPKDFNRVVNFIEDWPKEIPLAVEFRHTDWYNDPTVSEELFQLLETNNISNVIVDTAGRRDLMHMRLTNPTAFVRYVGANHPTDYTRLDDWIKRLKTWKTQGIKEIDFFIHQNIEKESPLLSAYFIKQLNAELGAQLKVPNEAQQQNLF
ncbi:uncharacterized protein YecE (DUF72 family) [Mesoflavibacter sabulilitoris]|uniref:DUF72 domain-containing protein n=1 Tax=Mesoflavibacter zeaxanthinifaciens subsp. sabulilitoris TaxID=1520893 RepID=A0A2T1NGH5_9FLAO|nr:DUF72 domain-containing protein [Mesoflavibacter zeaxanthinifaciens]MBB3122947.1 uncharacterized protein YecE (DUF72 family) [Mesoflavibacter zeaxanthinifaciens subsp. sabulilitoris]PSG91981.1 DUF72 domain-containing protein [Mesoflavibacter zeaxanthinifaciens subsp. sabulilitoris]